MTFWEFSAAAAGWVRANGGKPKVAAPSDDEFEQALLRH